MITAIRTFIILKNTVLLSLALGSTFAWGDWEYTHGTVPTTQGGDIVITNLDYQARPDALLLSYEKRPRRNAFVYRIGHNLNGNGDITSWSPTYDGAYVNTWSDPIEVPGVGWEAQGAGAAITQLDEVIGENYPLLKDVSTDYIGRPELILMAYDNPRRGNTFRYRVGKNIGPDGKAQSWSEIITVPGLGWEAEGADVLITNLDITPRPEMILMAYDAPSSGNNTFRYKIGWNLDKEGRATQWTRHPDVPGVGSSKDGAGMAIFHTPDNNNPNLIFMAHDTAQSDGTSNFRMRIGWGLQPDGDVSAWSNEIEYPMSANHGTVNYWPRFGQGAGVEVFSLNLWDPNPELVFMSIGNQNNFNALRYVTRENWGSALPVYLEMDKLANVDWPPSLVAHRYAPGAPWRYHTLPSIYARAGIDVDIQYDQGNLPDTGWADGDDGFNDDMELAAFMEQNRNSDPGDGRLHLYAAILDRGSKAGVMFDLDGRRAIALFMEEIIGDGDDEAVETIKTLAHEMGHMFCLQHYDGDGYTGANWSHRPPYDATTIMNQTMRMNQAEVWDLGWSANSLHHFYQRSRARWMPGNGVPWDWCL